MFYEANDHPRHAINTQPGRSNPEHPLIGTSQYICFSAKVKEPHSGQTSHDGKFHSVFRPPIEFSRGRTYITGKQGRFPWQNSRHRWTISSIPNGQSSSSASGCSRSWFSCSISPASIFRSCGTGTTEPSSCSTRNSRFHWTTSGITRWSRSRISTPRCRCIR